MKTGWAYLGLSVLLVLLGVYVSLVEGHWAGDLLLVIAIGLIFYGSHRLAEEDAAADLMERAK